MRYACLSLRRRWIAATAVLLLLPAAVAVARVSLGKFGSRGILKLASGQVLGVATQRDGHVIAVGDSGSGMLVERMKGNGAGVQRIGAGRGVADAVAVQGDSKILVAGTTDPNGTAPENGDMVLKRFNANGSPDRKFGSGGTARSRGAVANAVALGPHGTIVIAGYIRGGGASPRVAIARFKSNGSADKSFGNGGFAEIDLGPFSQANGVAVQRDGKVVFGGDKSPDLQVVDALIGRVTGGGSLDHGFGTNGVYNYGHPRGGDAASFHAVAVDGAGRIVGVGGDVEGLNDAALFVRLNGGGRLDGGFGPGGVITTTSAIHTLSGDVVGANAFTIAPNGEIIASGRYVDSGLNFAALWTISRGGRLDGLAGPGGLMKTLLPAVAGGDSRGIARASNGSVYFGGELLPSQTKPQAFVGRYSGL